VKRGGMIQKIPEFASGRRFRKQKKWRRINVAECLDLGNGPNMKFRLLRLNSCFFITGLNM
jgi:hypothetical protein